MFTFSIPFYGISNTNFIVSEFKLLNNFFTFLLSPYVLNTSAACRGFFVTLVLIFKLFIIFNILVILMGLEEQMLKISNFLSIFDLLSFKTILIASSIYVKSL